MVYFHTKKAIFGMFILEGLAVENFGVFRLGAIWYI
jgi:hypothetical protein